MGDKVESSLMDKSPDEAKFVVEKNGDAKIDLGKAAQVSGLTKEELMKYADDPFWVRLRWFLFILFWAGWLAMLIVAIVIIVKAPGCAPPPELIWVQESAIIEVDTSKPLPLKADEIVKQCNSQDATSVYFPNLMYEDDFEQSNYEAEHLFNALLEEGIKSITDMPGKMSRINPLYDNFTNEGLVNTDGTLNYTKFELAQAMYENVAKYWMGNNVKGYLIADDSSYELQIYIDEMNRLMKDDGGAIDNEIKSVMEEIEKPFDAQNFRAFLEEETGNWSYFKFTPSYLAAPSTLSADDIRLMDIALYLFPATPILPLGSSDNKTDILLTGLADLRNQDGNKFGETYFANSTSDNIVGFTRVHKGTPAYAVALNFGSEKGVVNFANTTNVAETATLELWSTKNETLLNTRMKLDMGAVDLGPFEGKVMQFVANFG